MDDKIIVIGAYPNISEAYIFKNILDLEGIESFIADAHAAFISPVPSPHDGGVKLYVRHQDAANAIVAFNKARLEK